MKSAKSPKKQASKKQAAPSGEAAARSTASASLGGNSVKPNAVWFKPVMFGLMLLGLLWILVHYIGSVSGVTIPIPGIGSWNILIGFGIVMAGFLMATRWR